MKLFSLRRGETIAVGFDITVRVCSVSRDSTKLAIELPEGAVVLRIEDYMNKPRKEASQDPE